MSVSVEATRAPISARVGAVEPSNGESEVRELRRAYHDRIAALRERSFTVLRAAISGTEQAVQALAEGDAGAAASMRAGAGSMAGLVAEVDDEVVHLLALESPVARDLRVILAARDVTQLALLCVGLAMTLADRVGAAARVADQAVQSRLQEAGTRTGALLRLADAAWTTLDPATADRVMQDVVEVRGVQIEFFSALLAQTDVPTDAAVDLGLAARALDRLADHAVEIAERVLFAATGRHAGLIA